MNNVVSFFREYKGAVVIMDLAKLNESDAARRDRTVAEAREAERKNAVLQQRNADLRQQNIALLSFIRAVACMNVDTVSLAEIKERATAMVAEMGASK